MWVGISGWRYASWRGDFYPHGLPQRRELEHAASLLDSVEINGTFYSLQRTASFRRWRDETPDGFRFAIKGGRYLTHMLRLREPRAALANFFAQGVLALGPRLGPVLWQLPARRSIPCSSPTSSTRCRARRAPRLASRASTMPA